VKRFADLCSHVCGLIACVFLTVMMLLTVADVTLRGLFNYPMRGVFELIELLLAATFFVALPAVFLRDENIMVNAVDDYFPRAVPYLKRFAELLALVVLVVMAWRGFLAAKDSFEFNDVTADLGLPRVWHWAAVLTGLVGSALAALYMALRREPKAEPGQDAKREADLEAKL
jgi:TRAP-type C4-dicarboxylate transport system permease small subunit